MKKHKKITGNSICFIILLIISVSLLFSAPAQAEDYGDTAYSHLQYIDANYQERWAGTESNARMREWLLNTVRAFGYSPEVTYAEGTSPFGWGDYSGYNITFYKRGQSEQEVVVCAHYDSVSTNGCEDNGTGVSVLLELAQRFANIDTTYTIRFILFDIEEPGCLGSIYYVNHQDISNVIAVINMDSVGVGDDLYVYGGDYEEDTFVRGWVLEQALETAQYTGIELKTIPANYQGTNARPPAKKNGSDHSPFNDLKIPYIYLASSYWTESEDTGLQQVSDPSIPNGKIMHVAEYDNFAFLSSYFGDRMRVHMSQCSKLVTYMLLYMNQDIPANQMYPEPTATPVPTPTETPVPTITPVPVTTSAGANEPEETADPVESKQESELTTEWNSESESESTESGREEADSSSEVPSLTGEEQGGLPDRNVIIGAGCVLLAVLVCIGVCFFNRKRPVS